MHCFGLKNKSKSGPVCFILSFSLSHPGGLCFILVKIRPKRWHNECWGCFWIQEVQCCPRDPETQQVPKPWHSYWAAKEMQISVIIPHQIHCLSPSLSLYSSPALNHPVFMFLLKRICNPGTWVRQLFCSYLILFMKTVWTERQIKTVWKPCAFNSKRSTIKKIKLHCFYENTDILSSPDLVPQMVLSDFDTVERRRTGESKKTNTSKIKFTVQSANISKS